MGLRASLLNQAGFERARNPQLAQLRDFDESIQLKEAEDRAPNLSPAEGRLSALSPSS